MAIRILPRESWMDRGDLALIDLGVIGDWQWAELNRGLASVSCIYRRVPSGAWVWVGFTHQITDNPETFAGPVDYSRHALHPEEPLVGKRDPELFREVAKAIRGVLFEGQIEYADA